MDLGSQIFKGDTLERYAAKGRGVITSMAAGNEVIVLGTSKGWIIRHDYMVGDSSEIDLSAGRPGEQAIHRVSVDPGGCHCIATVVGGGTSDTFYTHAKWNKPKILSKLRGLVVNSVAWNKQLITEASTKEVVLGTDNGHLYEIAVDEKDKKEKYIKFLFELTELPEAFMGLQMETTVVESGTRYYVMAVTPTRLYSFTGIGSLETVFASYLERAVHFMELPGEIPNSELHFYIKQRRAVHFAWLSGAGIYHGDLNFGAQRGGGVGRGMERKEDAVGGGGGGGGRSRGRRDSSSSFGKDKIDALGRLLTRVLRHMAAELNLSIRSDGYVKVNDLLKLNLKTYANNPLRSHTIDDVREAVRRDNKQRFSLMEEDGELLIRANQGHTIQAVESKSLLKPITSPEEVPACVHGTYSRNLESILQSGLKRMKRLHVHFSLGLPTDGGVISGMRRDVNILIFLDVRKASADGMKLYISDNKVILTEGFEDVVPVKYFEKIETWPDRRPIPLS